MLVIQQSLATDNPAGWFVGILIYLIGFLMAWKMFIQNPLMPKWKKALIITLWPIFLTRFIVLTVYKIAKA